MKKPKCKYCKREKEEAILILDLFDNPKWEWICLECLLSRNAQEYNDKKEINKIIKFYIE